ncbi:hypothetical protein [Polynucleobacter yangtzensis]|uniref:hypothetical protein n=1 Tax=Polynucleobacter yangtzensis TaxID=1743159 RepID=UPI000AE179A6|nr:hypothetical protein [Polynucleobacter yangtzensis]
MLSTLGTSYKQLPSISIETLPHWQQSIISSINSLKHAAGIESYRNTRFNKKAILSLRPYIPYLIHGTYTPGVFIIVNRDYRPIGMHWSGMVDYDHYPHLHLTPADVAAIKPHYYSYQGWAGSVDGNFFMDGSSPCISKQHAEKLVKRLEKIIETLNPGVEII